MPSNTRTMLEIIFVLLLGLFVFWPWVMGFVDIAFYILTDHASGVINYSQEKFFLMAFWPFPCMVLATAIAAIIEA